MLIYKKDESNNIIEKIKEFYNKKNYKGFYEFTKGNIGDIINILFNKENKEYYILLKRIWDNGFKEQTKIHKTFENFFSLMVENFKISENKLLRIKNFPIIEEITSKFFLDSIILGIDKQETIVNEIYLKYFINNKIFYKKYVNIPIEAYLLTQVYLIENGFKLTNVYDLLENEDFKIDRVYIKEKVMVYFEKNSKENIQITTISINPNIFKLDILENIKDLSDIKSGDIILSDDDKKEKFIVGSYSLDYNNFSLIKPNNGVVICDKIFSTIYNPYYIKDNLNMVDEEILINISKGIIDIKTEYQDIIKTEYKLYKEKIGILSNFLYSFEKNGGGYFYYNSKYLGDNKEYQNLYNSLGIFKNKLESKIENIISNTNIFDWANNNFPKSFDVKINEVRIREYKNRDIIISKPALFILIKEKKINTKNSYEIIKMIRDDNNLKKEYNEICKNISIIKILEDLISEREIILNEREKAKGISSIGYIKDLEEQIDLYKKGLENGTIYLNRNLIGEIIGKICKYEIYFIVGEEKGIYYELNYLIDKRNETYNIAEIENIILKNIKG